MLHEILRSYIQIAQTMGEEPQPEVLVEDFEAPPTAKPQMDYLVEEQLSDLLFKLRSYQDPDTGDHSAGVEAGMVMAADLLQNVISRLRGE